MRTTPIQQPATKRLRSLLWLLGVLALLALRGAGAPIIAQSNGTIPPVPIANDQGGPVVLTGELTYTNAFFTLGTAAPMVILEDQAGFIDRNEGFILPIESQTLGQITSDFYTSPFSYSLALPIEPQATLRDVDHDGSRDRGVMVFAVAYWRNIFGDPFLEERDLFGGGWSTAYASTRISTELDSRREVIGGKLLIFAPDDRQAFPTDFGADGLLFTADDPVGRIPAGYMIVDMDSSPFTFDRSRRPTIDLIEPKGSSLEDYSSLSYAEAFGALVDTLSREYAFTAYKSIDWGLLRAAYMARFEEADANRDALEYRRALRDFSFEIPDGHISGPFVVEDFRRKTAGGIGLAIRDLDDGRVVVNFVTPNGPAAEAGIEVGAEITAINGLDIDTHIDSQIAYSAPFSTPHFARLQKLRYAIRFPLGTALTVNYSNPGADAETVTLVATAETESFSFSSFNVGLDGFELPLDYTSIDDYGYAQVFSFSDNELLTIQLWERMIRTLNDEGVPGLVIDMRQNGGGKGFLADQMAAYFFDTQVELGNTGYYDETLDDFYFDEHTIERFYLPAEDLRYDGALAVLIGPNCNSACEFFAYDLSLNQRAAIVGHYPTAGLGGAIDVVLMPENELFQYTAGRAVNTEGEIHIEGKGVAPTIRVPIDQVTLFDEDDPVLQAALDYLDEATALDYVVGGEVAIGDTVSGNLYPGVRVEYFLQAAAGDVFAVYLEDGSGRLDTVLRVYDERGNLLASNDDAEQRDSANSAIELMEIPIDLGLIIEVATYEDISSGAYTLRVVPAEAPAPEFNIQTDTEEPPLNGSEGEEAAESASVVNVQDAPGANNTEVAGPDIVVASLRATIATGGPRLSVRSEPDADSARLGFVPNASTHAVLAISPDGRWLRIALPDESDVSGWISSRYVSFDE